MQDPAIRLLIKEAKSYYRKSGRSHMPWRKTSDPYHILVSEIMLQQTQVERVIPHYIAFMERFPTAQSLSKAALSEVLGAWQGLGYNLRGRMLRDAARAIMKEYQGVFPR